MAKKKKSKKVETSDYRHEGEKRKNIPPAKIAAEGEVPRVEKVKYAYNPHLPPVLRFDPTGEADRVADLVAEAGRRPLTEAEQSELREATSHYEPWLEWAGKREEHERGFFGVDPVALHIHERISAQAIVRAAMRQDAQRDLFADPQQPYQEAVEFYRHDVEWANRFILGDSLEVMSSLSRREGLAGNTHVIYIDPPYGIQFRSNFQPVVRTNLVGSKDSDLARAPEVARAFRDTWTLGTHSYLSYLRSRLLLSRELLADSGSLFLQMGDENVHVARNLLDEVFGPENFVAIVAFKKTTGLGTKRLAGAMDFLLWYAKDVSQMKYRSILPSKVDDSGEARSYQRAILASGESTSLAQAKSSGQSFEPYQATTLTAQGPGARYGFDAFGREVWPSSGQWWKTDQAGMERLYRAGRLVRSGNGLRYLRYLEDHPAGFLNNMWEDTAGSLGKDKVYVVQTGLSVVERCLLMASDPGDLVLDPTCGSGTTALAAEKWGRRWISCDTSRVAIFIARSRLLTATFPYYQLIDEQQGPRGGFVLKTIPHITPSSTTSNQHLDPILEKHTSLLEGLLSRCNEALREVPEDLRSSLSTKLAAKKRDEGARSITDADRRRWLLPPDNRDRSATARKAATVDLEVTSWYEWEVPFDTDPDWPQNLQDAVLAYREALRAKMKEVDECIAANAKQEELVDQPEVTKGVLRVSGPFTIEGVRPEELSLGEEGLFDGTPNTFEASAGEDAELLEEEVVDEAQADLKNTGAYLSQMVQLLRQDGVTFLNNQHRDLARMEALFDSPDSGGGLIHAEGEWAGEDGVSVDSARVGIGFGPQYGPVTAQQVEELVRAAARRYDELVVAGFSFDAEASAVIQEASHPSLRIHLAYVRPDVNPGMEGLLKDTPNSQLFTVFGQPEIDVRAAGDEWVCELLGIDIYDPLSATVKSTGASKVAAWFLDQDYDGRCFCITQAFFPDQKAWDKIAKALGSSADPDAFAAFEGTVSLPFASGKHRRIAVKVIDPRGNEVMAIRKLEG